MEPATSVSRMVNNNINKFNIIGFNQSDPKQYKHCVIHPGIRLIQSLEDPDKLFCTTCGMSYLPKEAVPDDRYQSRFSKHKTQIITGKKQGKYYDQSGNLITDETVLQDIAQGAHVISYHEYLPENSSSETDTRDRTFPRKRK